MILIDERTEDGSRRFARLPRGATWEALTRHVRLLPNATLVHCMENDAATAWLDFTFRGHRFVIHRHESRFHLCVRDPQCSELILYQVGCHFERLLGSESSLKSQNVSHNLGCNRSESGFLPDLG